MLQRQQIPAPSHAAEVSQSLRWKKGFPSLPSYYLHTVRDYTEAGTGTLCQPICFLFENSPKLFHYLLHIKADLKRKPGLEGSVQSRLSPHPAQPRPPPHSHPAYCFSIQEGCASPPSPPPYSHSPPAPASFGPVPYFPPTIASPVTIIFLFHWTAPRGYGVWRWRQDLSLNWQHRCCAFWLTTLIVDVQSISDEKSLMGWLDVDFYNVFWTMLKKWGLIQLMSRRLTDWLTEGKELKITNYSNSYDQLCNSGEIKYKLCINYNDVANKPNVNTYIIAAINTTTTTTASAT